MPQEKKLTDRLIKKAYNECKAKPFIPAASLADRLGFNARYMTRELVALVKADKFEMIKIGNMFLFRPK